MEASRGQSAIGQEAEVADPDEALGSDAEQEATDELLRRQRHDLHAIAVGAIYEL
jgi:hypothetical protein